jgi:hypothetical protein
LCIEWIIVVVCFAHSSFSKSVKYIITSASLWLARIITIGVFELQLFFACSINL